MIDKGRTKQQMMKKVRKLDQRIDELNKLRVKHSRIKEKLQNKRLLFSTVLETLPVGVGISTLDGKILFFNNSICQMTGYSKNELMQMNWRDTYQNPEERSQLLDRVTKEGGVHDFELVLKRKDGSPSWANLTLIPLSIQGKKVLLGVSENITERKKMEETLKEYGSRLQEQNAALERRNNALVEVINMIEIEKKRITENIKRNIDTVLSPILEKLKLGKTPPEIVNLIQHHLEEFTSSYGAKISSPSLKLTPKEIEICNLVKGGLASKDISRLLHISYRTVERHRKNIRHKLGISNKHINLISYLRQL